MKILKSDYVYSKYHPEWGCLIAEKSFLGFWKVKQGEIEQGNFSPSKAMWIWHSFLQKRFPKEGEEIEITWLPNPINHPHEKNCYIGSRGIVRNVDQDGNFDLKMENAWLVGTVRNYSYKKITKWIKINLDNSPSNLTFAT